MADHIHITISPKHNLQVERVVLCHLYILASDNCFKALNCNSTCVCTHVYLYVHKRDGEEFSRAVIHPVCLVEKTNSMKRKIIPLDNF